MVFKRPSRVGVDREQHSLPQRDPERGGGLDRASMDDLQGLDRPVRESGIPRRRGRSLRSDRANQPPVEYRRRGGGVPGPALESGGEVDGMVALPEPDRGGCGRGRAQRFRGGPVVCRPRDTKDSEVR
ncbi:hypothetical protein WUBG_18335 [Wuchereria bancrofti]|uniref:Uncharacterized protein n=1 Tax=Wuchereria bancrofti TaxID=6293 RepID=J9E5X9_WUCBA|nr:hypothetical protein WUBG_18335 [Wuchereria bancrofti]